MLNAFKRFCDEDDGAVMMEYVIIAVLVAAACAVAVVLFSQSVGSGFGNASRGVSGQAQEIIEIKKVQKAVHENNSQAAKKYHDSMHSADELE